jgi:hypothetical protein
VKDRWVIVREQYPIRIGLKRIWIDLSVEKEDVSATAFIEVKDFEMASVESLRDTIGQYILYRAAMKYAHLGDIRLFLAIPRAAFIGIFSTLIGELAIREAKMNLMVFDPVNEVIEQWLPYQK